MLYFYDFRFLTQMHQDTFFSSYQISEVFGLQIQLFALFNLQSSIQLYYSLPA